MLNVFIAVGAINVGDCPFQALSSISGNLLFSLWRQPYWWSRVCFKCQPLDFNRENFKIMNAASRQSSTVESGFWNGAPSNRFRHRSLTPLLKFYVTQTVSKITSLPCWRSPYPPWFPNPLDPLTLYMLQPMVLFFWPPEWDYQIPQHINDAISAFLVPAGLVYAIAFGFALQDTIEKLKDVTNVISDHASAIKQIALLTYESSCYSKSQKLDILVSLKNSTLFWMRTKFMKEAVVKPLCDGMLESYWSIFFHFH